MNSPIDAILALLALIGLVCLFYGPWQSLCTDLARQIIFERRDKLFDLALAGRINFDSETYRAARKTMNGMIRFAHEITWVDMVFHQYAVRKHEQKISSWRSSLQRIEDDELRDEIKNLVTECS